MSYKVTFRMRRADICFNKMSPELTSPRPVKKTAREWNRRTVKKIPRPKIVKKFVYKYETAERTVAGAEFIVVADYIRLS